MSLRFFVSFNSLVLALSACKPKESISHRPSAVCAAGAACDKKNETPPNPANPTPTPTDTQCDGGEKWSTTEKKCVTASTDTQCDSGEKWSTTEKKCVNTLITLCKDTGGEWSENKCLTGLQKQCRDDLGNWKPDLGEANGGYCTVSPAKCEEKGGVPQDKTLPFGRCFASAEERDCRVPKKGEWKDNRCITPSEADCVKDEGSWQRESAVCKKKEQVACEKEPAKIWVDPLPAPNQCQGRSDYCKLLNGEYMRPNRNWVNVTLADIFNEVCVLAPAGLGALDKACVDPKGITIKTKTAFLWEAEANEAYAKPPVAPTVVVPVSLQGNTRIPATNDWANCPDNQVLIGFCASGGNAPADFAACALKGAVVASQIRCATVVLANSTESIWAEPIVTKSFGQGFLGECGENEVLVGIKVSVNLANPQGMKCRKLNPNILQVIRSADAVSKGFIYVNDNTVFDGLKGGSAKDPNSNNYNPMIDAGGLQVLTGVCACLGTFGNNGQCGWKTFRNSGWDYSAQFGELKLKTP